MKKMDIHEISTSERSKRDDGLDLVDLLDCPGYSETALLKTLLLRYLACQNFDQKGEN